MLATVPPGALDQFRNSFRAVFSDPESHTGGKRAREIAQRSAEPSDAETEAPSAKKFKPSDLANVPKKESSRAPERVDEELEEPEDSDVELIDVEDLAASEDFNSFQYWRDPLPPIDLGQEPMLVD